jgi:uncharacterized membrane protein
VWLLAFLCLAGFSCMEYLAINQWLGGRWFLADVGNIQYCLVNTWNGKFMYSPLDEANFFAGHFSPILFLMLPLIWLSVYPIPLVTTYQLALALTPVPIYIIARQRSLAPVVAVSAGFWFLCNHFVGSLELSNHFESLYVLFALSLIASLHAGNKHAWWVFAILALAVKEDAALWILGYACWEYIFHRSGRGKSRATWLVALCVGWAIVAVVVMVIASTGASTNASRYLTRMNGISISRENLWVFLLLIVSSAGMCLANWKAAILLLIPIPVLLGNYSFTRTLQYYYSYPFLPFLAYATLAGAASICEWGANRPNVARHVTKAVSAVLLLAGAVQLSLPTRVEGQRRFPQEILQADDLRRHVAADCLPRNAPVAVQFGMWGIIPWRPDTVWLKPGQYTGRHYLLIDQFGAHGLAKADYEQLRKDLQKDVDLNRRKVLYDAYGYVVLSPWNYQS